MNRKKPVVVAAVILISAGVLALVLHATNISDDQFESYFYSTQEESDFSNASKKINESGYCNSESVNITQGDIRIPCWAGSPRMKKVWFTRAYNCYVFTVFRVEETVFEPRNEKVKYYFGIFGKIIQVA